MRTIRHGGHNVYFIREEHERTEGIMDISFYRRHNAQLLVKESYIVLHDRHGIMTEPVATARNMKGMLKKYNCEVLPLSDEGITDVDTYRDCLRTLYS